MERNGNDNAVEREHTVYDAIEFLCQFSGTTIVVVDEEEREE